MLNPPFKSVLVAVLLLTAGISPAETPLHPPQALPDLPVDKAAHFGLSGMATIATMRIWQIADGNHEISTANRIVSSLLVFGVGLAKEVNDRQRKGDHALDVGDLNADASGVLAANILMITF